MWTLLSGFSSFHDRFFLRPGSWRGESQEEGVSSPGELREVVVGLPSDGLFYRDRQWTRAFPTAARRGVSLVVEGLGGPGWKPSSASTPRSRSRSSRWRTVEWTGSTFVHTCRDGNGPTTLLFPSTCLFATSAVHHARIIADGGNGSIKANVSCRCTETRSPWFAESAEVWGSGS